METKEQKKKKKKPNTLSCYGLQFSKEKKWIIKIKKKKKQYETTISIKYYKTTSYFEKNCTSLAGANAKQIYFCY